MPRCYIAIALTASACCSATTVTYTPTGGSLNATDFSSWLVSNAAAGADTLILAPGTYTVAPPSSTTNGAHLFLHGPVENAAVVADDVTLVMQDRGATAVLVNGWINVTLRGLTTVYAELPSNQAAILAISPDGLSFTVQVPAGYPLGDWTAGTVAACNVFDPATRWWKPGTFDLSPSSLTPLGAPADRTFAMNFSHDCGPSQENVATGDLLGCRIAGGAFTFHVAGCENSTFAGVTLLGGPGFGFFAEGTAVPGQRGGNAYRECAIRRPPRPAGAVEDPLVSTSADGFHMAGVPWGPRIDSCFFEGMCDDGIAIHGTFRVVTDADYALNRIWIVSDDYLPGDSLRLYNASFAPPLGSSQGAFTIVAVAPASPGYKPPKNTSHTMPSQQFTASTRYLVLTLQEPLPPGVCFDYIASNADRTGNGFSISNTTVANHRARGMLIKASHGQISGNYVHGSTMGALIITPELYWGEADYARGVVVINNTFEYVGYGKQSYGGVALGAVNPDGSLALPGGHFNVTIAGNTWRNISFCNLWVSSAFGVVVANNTFDAPFSGPLWADCCPPVPVPPRVVVFMSEATGVAVSGNCVRAPGPNDGVFNVTATVTGSGLVDGVQLCA